jgi:hypothetical protein
LKKAEVLAFVYSNLMKLIEFMLTVPVLEIGVERLMVIRTQVFDVKPVMAYML